MMLTRGRPRQSPAERATAYSKKRQRETRRSRENSAKDRDIAPLPAVADPKRRKRAEKSFRKFCEYYFSEKRFTLRWAPAHLEVIADIERIVTTEGVVAVAMPRGSGKSALAEVAVLWAVMCHQHSFVMLIACNKGKSEELLRNVRAELEGNELLAADFPEVCYPLKRLGGINQSRMLFEGKPIKAKLGAKELVLPQIPGHAPGAVIRCAGLLGGDIRGAAYVKPNGERVRPSLFIADDPQTRKSAKSPKQNEERERILAGDVLGMAGPDRPLAGIVTCTVVQEDDMADRILNRKTHPQYNGRRYKMVEGLPADKELKEWREYGRVRNEGLAAGDKGKAGDAHYKERRKEIERNLTAYWPDRYYKGEVSAIQRAVHLWIDDKVAFYAEYQNDPAAAEQLDEDKPTAKGFVTKLTRLNRSVPPIWTRRLLSFIDVQQKVLFYTVLGFGDDFSSSIVDYGTFPDQGLGYFSLRSVEKSIEQAFAATGMQGGFEQMLWWALDQLLGKLLKPGRYKREDGMELSIERNLIDSGWGDSTELVYEYCRRSAHSSILLPSKGVGISAKQKPMTEWVTKPHEPAPGLNWILSSDASKRAVRLLQYDTNWWKTFVCHRAATPPGGRGALSIFGQNAEGHRQLLDHCCAETPIKTTGRGRVVWDWVAPPGVDNHWWDCIVGSHVAASYLGCRLSESQQVIERKRWTAEDVAKARGRRGDV